MFALLYLLDQLLDGLLTLLDLFKSNLSFFFQTNLVVYVFFHLPIFKWRAQTWNASSLDIQLRKYLRVATWRVSSHLDWWGSILCNLIDRNTHYRTGKSPLHLLDSFKDVLLLTKSRQNWFPIEQMLGLWSEFDPIWQIACQSSKITNSSFAIFFLRRKTHTSVAVA